MQSRFLMGFVIGALAVGGTWFFLSYPADPTGAAIGIAKKSPAKAAKPTHNTRSHAYMAFSETGSHSATLFSLKEGDQPDDMELDAHCKLECDWEPNCRGVEMTGKGKALSCALKGAPERASKAGSTFLQKWARLAPGQARTLAMAELEAYKRKSKLKALTRQRFEYLGAPEAKLDTLANKAAQFIEDIANRKPLSDLKGTWGDLLETWGEPSPASVSLFVQWSMRVSYEVSDARLQVHTETVSRLNAKRQLLWTELSDVRKRMGEVASLDPKAPFEPAVKAKDIGVSDLTGAFELVESDQVSYGTKSALSAYSDTVKAELESAKGDLKKARRTLSSKLKEQQTFYQGLASVSEMLLGSSQQYVAMEDTVDDEPNAAGQGKAIASGGVDKSAESPETNNEAK